MKKKSILINLDKIDTIYEGEKIPVIKQIDLKVNQNDFIAIVGPNGAGKTTLLETINGILPHTSGTAEIFGKNLLKHKTTIRKDIGYVIQNFELDPRAPFLCKDIVMSGRSGKIGLFRFTSRSDWDVIWKCMGLVGMIDHANKPVGKLSGGEFQKILIARALAQEPRILLLDEPFSNLDVSAKKQIETLLNRIHEQYKTTIIMVSHDLTYLPDKCNRMIVMDNGSIIRDDNKETLLHDNFILSLFPQGGVPP